MNQTGPLFLRGSLSPSTGSRHKSACGHCPGSGLAARGPATCRNGCGFQGDQESGEASREGEEAEAFGDPVCPVPTPVLTCVTLPL